MKVTHKKLGNRQAWGIAEDWKNKITLDERLVGKKHLEILIHEVLHIQNPDWSESMVLKKSKELTKVLWSQNYRRVDNKHKQPPDKK
jgi:hypothetical protein